LTTKPLFRNLPIVRALVGDSTMTRVFAAAARGFRALALRFDALGFFLAAVDFERAGIALLSSLSL